MFISIDAKHLIKLNMFMLQTPRKLGIEENFDLIKVTYKNLTDSILNVVTLKISS